jgi:hypothetical protein
MKIDVEGQIGGRKVLVAARIVAVAGDRLVAIDRVSSVLEDPLGMLCSCACEMVGEERDKLVCEHYPAIRDAVFAGAARIVGASDEAN